MRFVRLTLFVLTALVLFSGSTLADTIDYQGAGTLSNHTAFVAGAIRAGHSWEVGTELVQIENLTTGVNHTGNLGELDVTTGTLMHCASGLCFTGGTLDIDNLANKDLFLGTFKSGNISLQHGLATLSAVLANGATTVIRLNRNSFSSQALVSTHVGVIPEPNALYLMGSGLVGLALLWRKKKTI